MPFILCRIVWAEKYQTRDEDFFAGNMKYPAQYKIAFELLNFRIEGSNVYGFVQNASSRINLEQLGAKAGTRDLSGVTVIWCALDESTRRLRVVGWYDNARVFSELQSPSRNSVRGKWGFQFVARAQDAHLLSSTERQLEVPMKAKRSDKGFIGQRNWFFPERSPNYAKFLESFSLMRIAGAPERRSVSQSDFDEGQRAVVEIEVSRRNPKLVAEAKRHYGYKCQVCSFSFEERYGVLGRNFIEVHHLIQLASLRSSGKTSTDKVRVVCANCHRMLHKRTPPLDLLELKNLLR